MSKMGYPLVGPNSIWTLHYSEWRILAEGTRVRNERREKEQERAANDNDHGGGFKTQKDRERARRAADSAASDLSKEMELARQGQHPDQQQNAAG